jgi:hypothetical protein
MHKISRIISLCFVFLIFWMLGLTNIAWAQDNPLNPDAVYLRDISKGRKILSMFTFSVSSGYQLNTYRITTTDYTMVNYADEALLSPGQGTSPSTGFTHWLSNPEGPNALSRNEIRQVFGGDSLSNQWSGLGQSIPVNLSVHYTLAERFRIGLGVQQEFGSGPGRINRKGSTSEEMAIDYPSSKANVRRIFVMLGARIVDYKRYTLSADLQIGNSKYLGGFDSTTVGSNTINLGLAAEYNFSIYSAAFLRAGIESRSYTLNKLNLPVPLQVNNPVYGMTFGLRFRIPDLKSCPISSCQVRYIHGHDGFEFRGSSIFRKQNLKYGEGYGKKDVRRK